MEEKKKIGILDDDTLGGVGRVDDSVGDGGGSDAGGQNEVHKYKR